MVGKECSSTKGHNAKRVSKRTQARTAPQRVTPTCSGQTPNVANSRDVGILGLGWMLSQEWPPSSPPSAFLLNHHSWSSSSDTKTPRVLSRDWESSTGRLPRVLSQEWVPCSRSTSVLNEDWPKHSHLAHPTLPRDWASERDELNRSLPEDWVRCESCDQLGGALPRTWVSTFPHSKVLSEEWVSHREQKKVLSEKWPTSPKPQCSLSQEWLGSPKHEPVLNRRWVSNVSHSKVLPSVWPGEFDLNRVLPRDWVTEKKQPSVLSQKSISTVDDTKVLDRVWTSGESHTKLVPYMNADAVKRSRSLATVTEHSDGTARMLRNRCDGSTGVGGATSFRSWDATHADGTPKLLLNEWPVLPSCEYLISQVWSRDPITVQIVQPKKSWYNTALKSSKPRVSSSAGMSSSAVSVRIRGDRQGNHRYQ